MTEYKTPSYVRKASNNYYAKMKNDPEKYKAYLEKRKLYQRKKKEEKKAKEEKLKQNHSHKPTDSEIYPHYSEHYNPSPDNSDSEN